jgi:hypothetical protein
MNRRRGTTYVVVRNRQVELHSTSISGPIHLFAFEAQVARDRALYSGSQE